MTQVDEHGRPQMPIAGNEADTLTGFLDHQRATLALKCRGLTGGGLLVQRGRRGGWRSRALDETHPAWEGQGRPSVRWVIVHMIEEYARHNGHADLLREAIDGETGE